MDTRREKIREALQHAAAEFLAREALPPPTGGLITVTNVVLSEDGKNANILMTVFPDASEERAVEFANRNRREFGDFFTKRVRGAGVPHIEFMIDKGEKNRQRLDELS